MDSPDDIPAPASHLSAESMVAGLVDALLRARMGENSCFWGEGVDEHGGEEVGVSVSDLER